MAGDTASASPDLDDHRERVDAGSAGAGAATLDEQNATDLHRLLHNWLARSPGRRVTATAGVLIVAQALVRTWLALRGWFVGDDFAFIGRAYDHRLLDPHFIFLAYASHVMPGSFVVVWVTSHLAVYNFVLPTLIDAALQLLTAVIVYRLLVALFGRRPAILVPLAWFVFVPLTVPAFVWWAAALNQSPQQLAVAAALLCHVRYLRHGRSWRGVAGAGCVALGLAFSEKTLLVVPLMAAITVLYFTGGPPLRRLRTAWTRHWKVWIAYLVVAVPYGLYYVLAVPSPTHSGASGDGYRQLVGYQVFHTLIPAFLGGPWRWQPLGSNAALADPTALAVVLATVGVAGVIAASIAWSHRASFGWLVLAGYEFINVTLLGISRAAVVGPLLGSEFRYATDLGLVTMLCASLACIPIAPGFARAEPQLLVRRRATAERIRRWREQPVCAALPQPAPRPLFGIAVVAFIVSALVSSVAYVNIFAPNLARPLIANAAREIRALPPDVRVTDTPVAPEAVWAMIFPYAQPSHLLKPLKVRTDWFSPGESTARLATLDRDGHLRRAAINGLIADEGPDGRCGWLLQQRPRTITLPHATVVPWNWIIRIGYISSDDATTTITAGDMAVPVALHRGIGEVYLMTSGVVSDIEVSGLRGRVSACTNDIQVGTPSAIPGSTP